MDSTANILQFCRLCLVKDGVNIPIFDEQGDIRQIYLKISSCLPVKVAREDHLPKKICDGCSNKLDNFYDFWRTSAESEKQLLAWLGATGKDAAQVNVKEEDNFDEPLASDISKNDDDENKCYMFEQKVEEGPPVEINDEPPPSKRPRRTAAVKAAIAMDQNSDDDGDSGEPITKMEDDSDETDGDDREPAFVDVPSTSADDQPGPSGVSKDGSDAPEISKPEVPCTVCSKIYSSVKNMMQHRCMRHNAVEGDHTCDRCGKNFTKRKYLHSHVSKVHINRNKHKCDLCDKGFSMPSHLQEHKLRVHEHVYRYSCDVCKKGFSHPKELNTHKKTEHEGVRFECTDCGKIYKTQSIYKQHLATHDEDFSQEKYRCDKCEAVLTTRRGLMKHIERHHSGWNGTPCNYCGKLVKELEAHLRIHTGEKPYQCTFCGRCFASRGSLRTHQMLHTKEKRYCCGVCQKAFTQRTPMVVHMRSHTGERPYQCDVCSKKFVTSSKLQRHKKNSCQGPTG